MSLEDMSQFSIDLNLFTNCTKNFSGDAALITDTFNSFVDTFSLEQVNKIRVFVDPQPEESNLDNYIEEINKNIPCHEVVITNGFADGYIKSTTICESDYLFQLEHDWIFTDAVTHSLAEIVSLMKGINAEHLRFNKRANVVHGEDVLVEQSYEGMKYCRTPIRSNNPHIVKKRAYLDNWNSKIDLSNTPKRADGVENMLRRAGGYVYGPMNTPQQVIHTDGRR